MLAARLGVATNATRTVVAPYRICPLGAHIDHQLGPVTAMAIDRGVRVAFVPADDDRVRLTSVHFPGEVAFSLSDPPARPSGQWGDYAAGAAHALRSKYRLRRGLAGVTEGSISGGGLSSSAAIGVALLLALEEVNGLAISPEENIRLDQAIENGFLGLKNGVLDQAAILLSRKRHLTRINCETLEHECIAAPSGAAPFDILIAQSGITQSLVGTDYNRRVDECAAAAEALAQATGRTLARSALGAFTAEEYDAHRPSLCGPPARRAEHFFTEVARVEAGTAAWREGNIARFGRLVSESGRSSIVNYECGSPPLIDLYELLIAAEGVYGARFSGAGFRGCCLALTDPAASVAIAEEVVRQYRAKHPGLADNAQTVLCQSDDGARLM